MEKSAQSSLEMSRKAEEKVGRVWEAAVTAPRLHSSLSSLLTLDPFFLFPGIASLASFKSHYLWFAVSFISSVYLVPLFNWNCRVSGLLSFQF